MKTYKSSCCFFALLILTSVSCFSQQTARKISVTAAPAILYNKLVFQPGIQYSSKKWAVGGEVSGLRAKKMSFDKGYWLRFQAEGKRFLNYEEDVKFYFSFQTAYSIRNFVTNDSGYYYVGSFGSDTGAYYSSAKIHSPVLSFAPKFGFELFMGKKWYLDMFGGIGVRYIFTKYNAQNVRPATFVRGFRDWGYAHESSWRFNNTQSRFHLTTGLRLGFRF